MKARAALTDSTRDLKDKLCPMFDLNPCHAVHLWPRSLVDTIFFDTALGSVCRVHDDKLLAEQHSEYG